MTRPFSAADQSSGQRSLELGNFAQKLSNTDSIIHSCPDRSGRTRSETLGRMLEVWIRGLVIIFNCTIFFAYGHRPKTKELLVVFLLLFTIWIISSLKEISVKKTPLTGNWTRVLQLPSQALYPLSFSHIVTQVVKNYLFNLRMSKTMPQTLDQYCSTLCFACFVTISQIWGLFN